MEHDDLRIDQEVAKLRGFDDYAFRLGDEMRGRRASMGKSLLDVERDLRIRAVLVDAIEKADPKSFEANWLIPGHVRSYARYLEMDPDDAYRRFCAECGYDSSETGAQRRSRGNRSGLLSFFRRRRNRRDGDLHFSARQADWRESRLAIDAFGSSVVLFALAGGILYVGWAVYDEVRNVVSPESEQALTIAEPELTATATGPLGGQEAVGQQFRSVEAPSSSSGGIGSIDPEQTGFFASGPVPAEEVETAPVLANANSARQEPIQPQLTANLAPTEALPVGQASEEALLVAANEVVIVPARPSWIRVSDVSGTTLFEKVLASGEQYVVPGLEEPARLRAGNSGSLYFVVDGQLFGPAGTGQRVVKNVDLSADSIRQSYRIVLSEAVPQEIHDLVRYSEALDQSE